MYIYSVYTHKTAVSYLTKDDYANAILIFISFTHFYSICNVLIYISFLILKVQKVKIIIKFYKHIQLYVITDQVIPAGVMDHPPFLHHCAALPLCVLDGLYDPHQWNIIACGWTKKYLNLLSIFSVSIYKVSYILYIASSNFSKTTELMFFQNIIRQ